MKRTISHDSSLSHMEKILNREEEILENMCEPARLEEKIDGNGVLNEEQQSSSNVSNTEECMKNQIVPKTRFHRLQCSEPFKNERVQTRRSRRISLLQSKHAVEHNLPQVSKTEKPILLKTEVKIEAGEGKSEEKIRAEECAIICTPDININAKKEETSSDENETRAIGIGDIDNNNDSSNNNKHENALNFAKESTVDKISLAHKDNSKSLPSTDSRLSLNEALPSEFKNTRYQLSRKRGLGNDNESPKCTLRHINAQAMPIYTRIPVTKNENNIKSVSGESLWLSQTSDKNDTSNHMDCDKAEKPAESPAVIEKESQKLVNQNPPRSNMDRTTDPRRPYLSNTDSEDTLSNVESVPNSPAREIWPKVAGKNLKLDKSVKNNYGQNILRRGDTSWITHKIPACINVSITETPRNTELKSTRKRKRLETEISSTLKCNIEGKGSGLRYYTEASEDQNPFRTPAGGERGTERSACNDNLGTPQEMPWLRHYERPQKTHVDTAKNAAEFQDDGKENSSQHNRNLSDKKKRDVNIARKTKHDTLIVGNPLSQLSNNPSLRKRGRPRKQGAHNSGINSEKNKRSGPFTDRASLNGSGLTKLELERLFFKFLQHGHFRIEPSQPPIVIHDNGLYQNFSTRMQCYDPRKYYTHPYEMEEKSNSDSQTYTHMKPHLPTDNNGDRYYPSNNAASGKYGHRPRSVNQNLHSLSKEYVGQTPPYTGNLSPYSTNTNIHSHTHSQKPATNTGSYDTIGQTNLVSNYMQSGYGTGFNYQQNFYNNNTNAMENNAYPNIYSGVVNTNGFITNMNNGAVATDLLSTSDSLNNDLNYILDTQNQSSIPRGEMDLTKNNGNTESSSTSNTVQNSTSSNVNPDWNLTGKNQHPDSVDGILMDLNSINNTNDSNQAMNTSSDFNTVVNNSNSTMNYPNPWMNRSNMINSRFSVLPPWHTSLPTNNSCLKSDNPYYSNIFHPHAGFTAFNLSDYPYTNMNYRNGVGINTEDPWMQSTFPSINEKSTFNNTSTEFWSMSSASPQENTSNQGMNLSLSTNASHPQPTSMEQDNNSAGIGHRTELNPNTKQLGEDTFTRIGTEDNNNVEESARGYGDEMSLPYALGCKNVTEDLDFNNVEMEDIDDDNIDAQQDQDLPEIQDYMNQTSDNFEACISQRYTPTGSPNFKIPVELPNSRETEMSKLRQELVDFTRQYSESLTTPTSQIQQTTEEIFI